MRKDGAYVTGEGKVATAEKSEDELIANPLAAIHAKPERLAAENLKLAQKVAEQDLRSVRPAHLETPVKVLGRPLAPLFREPEGWGAETRRRGSCGLLKVSATLWV